MTALLQCLFEHLDDRVNDFLPSKYFWHNERVRDLREEALLATLSEEQQALWEDYLAAEGLCADLRDRALFQAALSLTRELSALTSPSV